MPAPYQVKFCYALQDYFDTEFWFHVPCTPSRPIWWKMDLGDKCKILQNIFFKKAEKYLSLNILTELNRFKPDVVILGNWFFPSCLLAYYWAKAFKKKVVIFTEILRKKDELRTKNDPFVKIFQFLYRHTDAIFTHSEAATDQLINTFSFRNIVLTAQYPADIDVHLTHQYREKKNGYTYLFANRLTEIYNPVAAINVLLEIKEHHSSSKMLMNADGELRSVCEKKIRDLSLKYDVEFLGNISSWNELHKVYKRSDILLLPALFSAGNFTVLEAMASGMGIIISNNIYGLGNLIEHYKNGFICEPNVEDFVKYATKYIEQPELLEIHGRINKKKVEKYSIAATAKLYNELIQNHVLK